MTDEYGDGWQGHVYSIADEDGNVVVSDQPRGFSTRTAAICLDPGVYTFEVGGDDFDDDNGSPSEIGWSLCGASGGVGAQESFVVHSDGTCGQIDEGSSDFSNSYSYSYHSSDGGGGGSSNCPTSSPAVTMILTDEYGDGWQGHVYMLADAQGNLEYSGTLASGSSTTQDWCLEPNYYIFSIPDSDPNGWGSEVGYSFCGISGGGVGGEETIVVNSDGTCECDLPESPLPPPH